MTCHHQLNPLCPINISRPRLTMYMPLTRETSLRLRRCQIYPTATTTLMMISISLLRETWEALLKCIGETKASLMTQACHTSFLKQGKRPKRLRLDRTIAARYKCTRGKQLSLRQPRRHIQRLLIQSKFCHPRELRLINRNETKMGETIEQGNRTQTINRRLKVRMLLKEH